MQLKASVFSFRNNVHECHSAARRANTAHFGDDACRVEQVMESVAARNDRERAIIEGQVVHVADMPANILDAALCLQRLRLFNHSRSNIQAGHLTSHFSERQRDLNVTSQ
jgi:hypothetical protein